MVPFSLTRPVRRQAADLNLLYRDVGDAITRLTKTGAAVKTHALSGELQLSSSGWGLLKVPNALVRGTFDALDEPGAELPLRDGKLNAHISVLRPEDIEQIGGPDKIKEFGHHFRYTLGAVMEVKPSGWKEVSKVWFLKVESPDLERLRRSYGLSSLPKDGKHDFHVTVGIRRLHVLGHNDVAKEGHHLPRDGRESGVQHLEGDEDQMHEPVPQAVQGLRGEGDHGLRKVGEQLHRLLRGHGTVSAGPHDREGEQRPRLQPGELRLAAEKQAEQEPAGQPVSRVPRGETAPGGVGGAAWSATAHDRQPARHAGVVGGEGADDGPAGVKRAEAVPDDGRRDPVLDGVVEAIREASGFSGGPPQARLDAAGGFDDAALAGRPKEAVDRLLKFAAAPVALTTWLDDEPGDPLTRIDAHDTAGKNVGYLTSHPSKEDGLDYVWLKGMKVDPAARGQGVAKALIGEALRQHAGKELRLRAKPYDDEPLSVEQLQALYSRFGFTPYDDEGRMVRPVDKLAELVRGPEAEYCPHCDARLERDSYSGTCNRCGKDWPEKSAAMIPHGGTVSYDYHCRPCDHSFDDDTSSGLCPLCGEDRSWTTTNPKRMKKTAGEILAGLLGGHL